MSRCDQVGAELVPRMKGPGEGAGLERIASEDVDGLESSFDDED